MACGYGTGTAAPPRRSLAFPRSVSLPRNTDSLRLLRRLGGRCLIALPSDPPSPALWT